MYQQVINWKTTLHFPPEPVISKESIDLIVKLCCGPEERLGNNGADEIKSHEFFVGIDFERGNLRKQPAPYVPEIQHPTDTSNFDLQDLNHDSSSDISSVGNNRMENYVNGDRLDYNGKHPDHAFFEFTFRRFFDDGGQAYPYVKTSHSNNYNNNHSKSSQVSDNNNPSVAASSTSSSGNVKSINNTKSNDNNTQGSPVYV